jgi:adenylate cyclase
MSPQYLAKSLRPIVGVLARFRVTRRDLRLGSGLVLFTYLAAHLANHALGLVSLSAAEIGLRMAVAVWHSTPGTGLLYGAAVIHLALAVRAVYERRTLRMPPIEAVRIALGFGMPLLLIGHFATARVGYELYGLRPDYHRIVWALWNSDGQGRQLALLAPGWVHGCLGVNLAFGRSQLYRRLRPLLLGIALLLPLLSALGFLAMSRELAVLGENRAWLETHVSILNGDQGIALARIRDGLLAAYVGVIGGALAGRALRAMIQHRALALVRISYLDRALQGPRRWRLLGATHSSRQPAPHVLRRLRARLFLPFVHAHRRRSLHKSLATNRRIASLLLRASIASRSSLGRIKVNSGDR